MKDRVKFYITLFIVILCFVTTLISVGFSALNQNLNISGDIEYDQHDKLLYNVLLNAASDGTIAQEFTGNHHDSFTEEPSKQIFYWYSQPYISNNVVKDKWNVIFGGFCWQMIRTTDTGGVKLIYNGVPNGGKCNNTGTDQTIGTSRFNPNNNSMAYVGYMYNKVYGYNYKQATRNAVLNDIPINTSKNYYYGTGVTYSDGKYILTDTFQDTWGNLYESSAGLYTCTSETDTPCTHAIYIAGGTRSSIVGFSLYYGNLLNYYNTNMVLGTSYTENNGIYTLSDTITISKADWFNNYDTYHYHYTCGDDSISCSNLKYISYTANYFYYSISSQNDTYVYGNDFTYNSTTNIYTLGNDRIEVFEVTNNDVTDMSTHHYTCFNNTGECSTLSYVYYAHSPSAFDYLTYINLENGKSVEDAINEMLYDDDVNTTDSVIKAYIDNWYQTNMTSYTSFLEDIIFCNNRTQTNASDNTWNSNGGDLTTNMYFNYSSLTCTNDIDKFCLSNNKAKLTYPVGLASYEEMYLLNYYLRAIDTRYWFGSPYIFFNDSEGACESGVFGSAGFIDRANVDASAAVRPVVSLKPGTEYTSGNGSRDDPYIVE